jgi:uncharacterized protein (TIGR01777 family)
MNPKRIVIAGGSGFIGSALTREFSARRYEVVLLTRTPRPRRDSVVEVQWDGRHVGDWTRFLDGAEAILNLTGKNINCPHTPKNLRAIAASRVDSVKALAEAVYYVAHPPRVWVQAGAIGFYGDGGDRICDETSPNGTGDLAKVCHEWEAAFAGTGLAAVRKVVLRIGFVLGRDGGALPVLARLTKCFLGGRAGDGKQFVSWIHLADLTQVFVAAVEQTDWSGVINAVAPQPVTNKEFMRELRHALYRPWSPPAPAFAVRLGAWLMRSEPSLALTGQRCVSRHLDRLGFQFQFPQLAPALQNLCWRRGH